jgi:hypothetical protein
MVVLTNDTVDLA